MVSFKKVINSALLGLGTFGISLSLYSVNVEAASTDIDKNFYDLLEAENVIVEKAEHGFEVNNIQNPKEFNDKFLEIVEENNYETANQNNSNNSITPFAYNSKSTNINNAWLTTFLSGELKSGARARWTNTSGYANTWWDGYGTATSIQTHHSVVFNGIDVSIDSSGTVGIKGDKNKVNWSGSKVTGTNSHLHSWNGLEASSFWALTTMEYTATSNIQANNNDYRPSIYLTIN